MVARLWNKYDVVNGKWAYVIDTINEKVIHVRETFLVVNIVWKDLPNQCTSAEQCAIGVQMNWSFFLNELMEDVVLEREVGNSFTYSWLLILIALVGWMERTHYQGMEVDTVNISRCKL